MECLQWKIESKVGSLYVLASARGLRSVLWKQLDYPMAESLKRGGPETAVLARTCEQLEEYFAGTRQKFDLPLDVSGTPFQRLVWDALSRIPYGKKVSYRDIACSIGKDKAMRAVGSANGKNPLSIIVPCHRVIAADGSLGGYAGGLEVKVRLLELEGSADPRFYGSQGWKHKNLQTFGSSGFGTREGNR